MQTDLDFEEFPITPVDEYPLHSGRVHDEDWFGCEYPERPYDEYMTTDWRCVGCVMHATASLLNDGDRFVRWHQSPNAEWRRVPFSWLVDRARYWAERT